MDLPPPGSSSPRSFRSPYRRRRVVWFTLLLTIAGLLFLTPPSFWEVGQGHAAALAEAGKAWMPSIINNAKPYTKEAELRDLLHMVASSELRIPRDVEPSKPLDPSVYKIDLGGAWLKAAEADPPVIVFSKTYCPYSKKAKELLETLNLSPPPKVIEVDLRVDADALKALLTRLTDHSTFPNVFIEGKSIGGSDDLQRLYEDGKLFTLLTDAGVSLQSEANESEE